MFTQQIRSSYSKLFKGNQQFKSEFMPEVNQKCYQTQKLTIGTIVKITSTNIYFDVNSKNFIKTKQKKFINTFYKIYKELTNTQNYSIKDFLNEIKLRKSFKFILYKLKSSDDNLFIDYDKTFEYFYYQKLFYELEHLKNLPQGFSLLVVPVTNSKVDIISLRDLFKIIKKEKDILFLGGLFEGSLINTSFVSDILNLKDPLTIYLEILQSISYPSTSISITSQNIVISTLLCLEEKATEK
jgi:hypothetical protein